LGGIKERLVSKGTMYQGVAGGREKYQKKGRLVAGKERMIVCPNVGPKIFLAPNKV